MDTNIDNYSIFDLLTLFSLSEDATDFEINNTADKMIVKMKNEGNTKIATFLAQSRDKLLQNNASVLNASESILNEDEENNEQFDESTTLGNWWKNQYPKQPNDDIQNQKITDRKQKIQYFSSSTNEP